MERSSQEALVRQVEATELLAWLGLIKGGYDCMNGEHDKPRLA